MDYKVYASTIEMKAQDFFLQQEKNGELYRQLVMKDEDPLSIPLKPPIKLSEWHTNFAEGNAWLEGCQEIAARYPYFRFEYQNHRFADMGNASIPVRITFTDVPAIFRLLGRNREASSYKTAYATVRETVPQLLPWMLTSKGIRTFKESTTVLTYLAVLQSLVKFFRQQREPSASPLYLRDIRLAPVDTKFWERESSFILAVYQHSIQKMASKTGPTSSRDSSSSVSRPSMPSAFSMKRSASTRNLSGFLHPLISSMHWISIRAPSSSSRIRPTSCASQT